MKIALCDDDKNMQAIIKDKLDSFSIRLNKECGFVWYQTGAELLAAPFDYDVLFLDIMLEDNQDGIEIGKQLRKMGNTALFILITTRTDRFLDGYAATVFRYLVKPVEQPQFDEVMLAVYESLERAKNMLPVKFNHQVDYVRLDDIIYIESYLRKRIVYTTNRQYQTWDSWAEIESFLDCKSFYRPQSAYLINFARVKNASKTALTMDNGKIINFVKGKYIDFNQKFMEYLGKQI